MKRRSLFAGLMAAFAPVVPAAPVSRPSAVDGMIAEAMAYTKAINDHADENREAASRYKASVDKYRAQVEAVYDSMAQASLDGMNALAKRSI